MDLLVQSGHSKSPYSPVFWHAGMSPACRLPPAPGDRRSVLSFPLIRPFAAGWRVVMVTVSAVWVARLQSRSGRVSSEGDLVPAQVRSPRPRAFAVADGDSASLGNSG